MKKLELNCKFTQILINYKEETALWANHNVEFKVEYQQNELVGYFKIWKDAVEPAMIKEEWKKLEEKAESFALGLHFIGNRKVSWKKINLLRQLQKS